MKVMDMKGHAKCLYSLKRSRNLPRMKLQRLIIHSFTYSNKFRLRSTLFSRTIVEFICSLNCENGCSFLYMLKGD